MNFIKKIFQGEVDNLVHAQFVRFGKGEYKKRAVLSLWKMPTNVKIKGSFEFANDFVLFVAGLGNFKFNGIILSKNEIPGLYGIKKDLKFIYNIKDISSKEINEMANKIYYFLLNVESPGIKLRIKSKLPRPGKTSEYKVDDKFCQLELDKKYYNEVKQDFFWDLPECKKAQIEHVFLIKELILPKGESDYLKIREAAIRKGKIIRIINSNGKEIKTEKEFEA